MGNTSGSSNQNSSPFGDHMTVCGDRPISAGAQVSAVVGEQKSGNGGSQHHAITCVTRPGFLKVLQKRPPCGILAHRLSVKQRLRLEQQVEETAKAAKRQQEVQELANQNAPVTSRDFKTPTAPMPILRRARTPDPPTSSGSYSGSSTRFGQSPLHCLVRAASSVQAIDSSGRDGKQRDSVASRLSSVREDMMSRSVDFSSSAALGGGDSETIWRFRDADCDSGSKVLPHYDVPWDASAKPKPAIKQYRNPALPLPSANSIDAKRSLFDGFSVDVANPIIANGGIAQRRPTNDRTPFALKSEMLQQSNGTTSQEMRDEKSSCLAPFQPRSFGATPKPTINTGTFTRQSKSPLVINSSLLLRNSKNVAANKCSLPAVSDISPGAMLRGSIVTVDDNCNEEDQEEESHYDEPWDSKLKSLNIMNALRNIGYIDAEDANNNCDNSNVDTCNIPAFTQSLISDTLIGGSTNGTDSGHQSPSSSTLSSSTKSSGSGSPNAAKLSPHGVIAGSASSICGGCAECVGEGRAVAAWPPLHNHHQRKSARPISTSTCAQELFTVSPSAFVSSVCNNNHAGPSTVNAINCRALNDDLSVVPSPTNRLVVTNVRSSAGRAASSCNGGCFRATLPGPLAGAKVTNSNFETVFCATSSASSSVSSCHNSQNSRRNDNNNNASTDDDEANEQSIQAVLFAEEDKIESVIRGGRSHVANLADRPKPAIRRSVERKKHLEQIDGNLPLDRAMPSTANCGSYTAYLESQNSASCSATTSHILTIKTGTMEPANEKTFPPCLARFQQLNSSESGPGETKQALLPSHKFSQSDCGSAISGRKIPPPVAPKPKLSPSCSSGSSSLISSPEANCSQKRPGFAELVEPKNGCIARSVTLERSKCRQNDLIKQSSSATTTTEEDEAQYDEPWDLHSNKFQQLRKLGSNVNGLAKHGGQANGSVNGVAPSTSSFGALRNKLTLNFGCSALNNGNASKVNECLALDKQDWYHGAIPRTEAETRLANTTEGSYLVRLCESNRDEYALSLKSTKGFMHMKIQKNQDGQWILGYFSHPFGSIPKMIRFYSLNKLPIKGAEHMCLLRPIVDQLL